MRSPTIMTGLVVALLTLGGCKAPTGEPHRSDPTVPEQATIVQRSNSGEATLVLMADIRGVHKSCGCTVDVQKGGFDRLKPFVDGIRREFAGTRLLHAGPLFFEEAQAPEEKRAQRKRQAEVTAELVSKIGVDVAGITPLDLEAAQGHFDALVEPSKVALTAANLDLPNVAPVQVIRAGDLDIGVFALASPTTGEEGSISVSEPKAAASRAVAELRDKADVIVLLSDLGLRNTKRLVRAVEGIDFAIAGGLELSKGERPTDSDEAELVGSTRVMQFYQWGIFVGRLTIHLAKGDTDFVDASAPSEEELKSIDARIAKLRASLTSWEKTRSPDDDAVRSARHHLKTLETERERLKGSNESPPADRSYFSFRSTSLSWDLPQDPDVVAIMDSFNAELEKLNLASAKPLPIAKPGEAVYVGLPTCMECHEETQTFWEKDKHSHAWETLVDLNKTFDTECVSCHVTGYDRAGGSTLGQTEGREDVQCEACHGPGSLHAESDGDVAIGIEAPTETVCVDCHNDKHSPRFEFSKWSKRLMVPGHGIPLE